MTAAVDGTGELQELLDDSQVESVEINGRDEVWVTYADARGEVRQRPLAWERGQLTQRRSCKHLPLQAMSTSNGGQ